LIGISYLGHYLSGKVYGIKNGATSQKLGFCEFLG
jgi:hypothetical protein